MCNCPTNEYYDLGIGTHEIPINYQEIADKQPLLVLWEHNAEIDKDGNIGIDSCIAEEIKALWKAGVNIGYSCCGHNRLAGEIVLFDDSQADLMKKLGYTKIVYQTEDSDKWSPRPDSYYLKSATKADIKPYDSSVEYLWMKYCWSTLMSPFDKYFWVSNYGGQAVMSCVKWLVSLGKREENKLQQVFTHQS